LPLVPVSPKTVQNRLWNVDFPVPVLLLIPDADIPFIPDNRVVVKRKFTYSDPGVEPEKKQAVIPEVVYLR
jgi:hypothetical protein